MDMHTLLYLGWTTNKGLLKHTGNSAQCGVQPGWEGSGGEWIHVHAWLSPLSVHLKPLQRCSLAIPEHQIKSF